MPELYPEDQEKVDHFLRSSINSVERKDFKLLGLLLIIFFVLGVLTGVSYIVAARHGII